MAASRDAQALGVLVAVLVAANIVRSTVVPDGVHLAFNLATGGAAAAVARWAQLRDDELGLAPNTWRRGLRYGVAAGAAVLAVLVVASTVPLTRGAFDDERAAIGGAELAARVLFVIPIGTVLVEELAFRGVLLGLAHRVTTPAGAAALTAGLFGLWHVLPAWLADGPAIAAGTLLATTAAGFGFGWLRTRSGSLLAPSMAHLATNSGALVASWLAVR